MLLRLLLFPGMAGTGVQAAPEEVARVTLATCPDRREQLQERGDCTWDVEYMATDHIEQGSAALHGLDEYLSSGPVLSMEHEASAGTGHGSCLAMTACIC